MRKICPCLPIFRTFAQSGIVFAFVCFEKTHSLSWTVEVLFECLRSIWQKESVFGGTACAFRASSISEKCKCNMRQLFSIAVIRIVDTPSASVRFSWILGTKLSLCCGTILQESPNFCGFSLHYSGVERESEISFPCLCFDTDTDTVSPSHRDDVPWKHTIPLSLPWDRHTRISYVRTSISRFQRIAKGCRYKELQKYSRRQQKYWSPKT